MIKEIVEERIEMWNKIGHPDLPGRFVAKHGIVMTPAKWGRRRGQPKQCYRNAFNAVLKDKDAYYVEGFCAHKGFAYPFQHAWISKDGETALDPTLRNTDEYEYFGIVFSRDFAMRTIMEKKVYGLLNTPYETVDVDVLVKFDPAFQTVIDEAMGVQGGHKRPRLVSSN